jgi:phosphatidate cytidylyltransferase
MVRVISASVLIALVVVTVWALPAWATVALAAIAAAIAGAELAGLARLVGADVPSSWLASAAAVSSIALAVSGTTLAADAGVFGAALLAVVVAAGVLALGTTPPGPHAFGRPAAMLLAATYIGAPLGAAAWVRVAWGPAALTWLLSVIALSDSAQYYTGRLIGRRKLSPIVSPGKTVEGAVGGLVAAAVVGGALADACLPGVRPGAGAGFGVLLALFGIAGDLFKSLLKRSAGVKDASALIPGHGGVLDRVDAYLFAAPALYVFLRFFA